MKGGFEGSYVGPGNEVLELRIVGLCLDLAEVLELAKNIV